MTGRGRVGLAAAGLGGTGSLLAVALGSPLPVLVVGTILVLVWLPLAVLLLTPVVSRDAGRCARAEAMVAQLLAALPSSSTAAGSPSVPVETPAPRSRRRRAPHPNPRTTSTG